MMDEAEVGRCQGCGSLSGSASPEALCSACLLEGALAWGTMEGEEEPEVERWEETSELKRCGDYELVSVIARGGMGVVFRARQAGLKREVALKMIAAAELAAPDDVRRLRLEAEVISQLNHPNIVTVHAVGEHQGRPFFVMNLAEGGTLAQRLANPSAKPYSFEEAAELVSKIARAVHFAHGYGVLHRDLKPANILLEADGTPLVSDFGLARLAQGPGGVTLTGTALGTPGYMAPEQGHGSDPVTTASDVYGLGAIFFHLLTGRAPFIGSSPMDVLRQVVTDEPPNPRQLKASVPLDLATIGLKCLEKRPERRYRSAAALADDLDRWLGGEVIMARPASWPERAWKWAKRRPTAAALVATGLLSAGILATVVVQGNILLRKERNYAWQQEKLARTAAERAEASEYTMRLNAYAADVFTARRMLDDGHLGATRATLERQRPEGNKPDLRGFEWYALKAQCHGEDIGVLTEHQGAVRSLAWNPTGEFLATGGRDGMIRVLQLSDRKVVKTIPEDKEVPSLADFMALISLPIKSPELEQMLLDGVNIDTIRMRGRPSRLGDITSMAWSADGNWMITACDGAYVRLWRTSDWKMQGLIPNAKVQKIEFTPDSQEIVLVQRGDEGTLGRGEIHRYDVATLTRIETIPAVVATFGLGSQEPVLAYTKDRILHWKNLRTQTTGQWPINDAVSQLAVSPDGKRLVAMNGEAASLRELATGAIISGIKVSPGGFRTLAYSSDGTTFATAGADQLVHVYDGLTGSLTHSWRGHDSDVQVLSYGRGTHAAFLASGGSDQTSRLWLAKKDPGAEFPAIKERASLISSSPNGSFLLGKKDTGEIVAWNRINQIVSEVSDGVPRNPLAIRDDGSFCTVKKETATIEWWDHQGKLLRPALNLSSNASPLICCCPKAEWIAVSSKRSPVALFHWETGNPLVSIDTSNSNAIRMTPSPDGRYLALLEYPRTGTICEVSTQKILWREKLSPGTTGPIAFSPDSRFLVCGGDEARINVIESASGQFITGLRGHMSDISSLSFSVDGNTLASCSNDKTVRLWHVPTWRELGPLLRGISASKVIFARPGLFLEEYHSRWLLVPGKPSDEPESSPAK